MRYIILSITFLATLICSGCKMNSDSGNNVKEFIGINISNKQIQELGSCDTIAISPSIFQDSLFFLFRIPPNACSSCYNRELSTIRDFFSNKKMPIIISSFKNCRDLMVFGSNYSLNRKELYNSTLLIKKLDKQSIPYYLFLDSSLIVRDVFISEKNNDLSSINFLSKHSSPGVTKIRFDTDNIDLNTIEKGIPNTVTFKFTNSGKKPFIIYHIKTSCGCTKSQWPEEPIIPNEQGEISVTYDAANSGSFNKSIKVFCNTAEGVKELHIKGVVKGKQES